MDFSLFSLLCLNKPEKMQIVELRCVWLCSTIGIGTIKIGKYPVYRKFVYESPKSFSCVGWKDKSCDFSIWKQVAGRKLDQGDAELLCQIRRSRKKTDFNKRSKRYEEWRFEVDDDNKIHRVILEAFVYGANGKELVNRIGAKFRGCRAMIRLMAFIRAHSDLCLISTLIESRCGYFVYFL